MSLLTRRDFGILAGIAASMGLGLKASGAAPSIDNVIVGIQGSSLIKLDPGNGDVVRGELSVVRSIYSALTQIAADGSIQPDLALDWEQVEDTVWEFNLREDATFTNGVKVVAAHISQVRR